MGNGVGFQGDLGFSPQSGGYQPSGGFGLPSPTPWWANPLAQFGGQALGGLAGLIAGPSESQKRARTTFDLAQNRLGQSVLDPSQYLAQYMQSMAPRFGQQAERIGSRLGLDSGLAQKALAGQQQSVLSGIMADLMRFNAQATAQQDLGLLQLMGQTGART